MKNLCDDIIRKGGYQARCPECDDVWDFPLVRHVLAAAVSAEQLALIGEQININSLAAGDIKQCPNCRSYCSREASTSNRVVCLACSRQNARTTEFCWNCLGAWTGDGPTCGNAGCDTTDWTLHVLATCKTKTIGPTGGVPSRRACARCGALIEHKERCKHMTCGAFDCKYSFCFVCLQPADAAGNYQCGGYDDPCEVAPRQTQLPRKRL